MPDGPMPSQGGYGAQPGAQGGQPGGQPPQGGQPQGQGGGMADAIVQLDQLANKIATTISQAPQIGNDVKSAWQDAIAALRKAEQALVQAAGGQGQPGQGQEPDEDDQGSGTTTMQQGAGKGVPMTHQAVRGR